MSTLVKVGLCQFPVSNDIARNAEHVCEQLRQAKAAGADIAHFPEAALSGYGGTDIFDFAPGVYPWQTLFDESERVLKVVAETGIMALIGSAHFVSDDIPPTNCLYVVSEKGAVVDRYDKRMLTETDRKFYTAGNRDVIFEKGATRFAAQICYDICYPAMYNRLRSLGVEVVLHSFYNAGFEGPNILDVVGPAWNVARAADNRMFICATNASRSHQNWPSQVTRPDGSVAASLERDETSVLVHAFPDHNRDGWDHNFKPFVVSEGEALHMGQLGDHRRIVDGRASIRPT